VVTFAFSGATQLKVAPLVTKKKKEKAHLFEGKKLLKKEGVLGKATKQISKNRKTKIKQGQREAHSHTLRHDAH
jgi:hypothetical protein